jgi:hypothetical protein
MKIKHRKLCAFIDHFGAENVDNHETVLSLKRLLNCSREQAYDVRQQMLDELDRREHADLAEIDRRNNVLSSCFGHVEETFAIDSRSVAERMLQEAEAAVYKTSPL